MLCAPDEKAADKGNIIKRKSNVYIERLKISPIIAHDFVN